MGESRLSSLALMHIKYDLPVDLEEIVTLFGSRVSIQECLVYKYPWPDA